jgi:glycosyltransferase involved in cell wall biosynthesis
LKTLILLTSEFPYGKGETFIENEFPFLLNGFEEIIIFSESNKGESRINNSSVQVHLMQSISWKSRISSLFNKEFYRELNYLRKKAKFNLSTFRSAWYSLSKALTISKQLETIDKKEPGVFYSYWLDEKSLALSFLKKKRSNIKVVSRGHGWDIYEDRHPNNYLTYRNLLAENLDSVYTISENGNSYLVNRYPRLKEKLQTSRLGTMPLLSFKEKSNIGLFHILSISSIIPLKRVDKILDVVSSIPNLKIKWTHIGNGPESEKNKIKDLAIQKSQLNQNFSFELMGHLTNSKVRELLSTNFFDFFINLSETEGIPVSIMEAQSAGIPVLATAVGGTPEIVNDENGILVDKDENITQKIIDYLNLPEVEKQKKRELSYQNWKENYNAETNYTNFIQTILKL